MAHRAERSRLPRPAAWTLALLGVGAACAIAYFASTAAAGAERDRIDARLHRALNASVAAAIARGEAAQQTAVTLARSPRIQKAVVNRDWASLRRAVAGRPDVSISVGSVRIGSVETAPHLSRSATIAAPEKGRARVTVSVPLGRLTEAQGTDDESVLAIVDGRVVAGPAALGAAFPARGGGPATVPLDGVDYRAIADPAPRAASGFALAAVTPQAMVDAAAAASGHRMLFIVLAVAASLVTLLLLLSSVLPGRRAGRRPRPIRRRRRRPAAASLAGDALRSTHDPVGLFDVILRTTMEATGAAFVRLMDGDTEVAAIGQRRRSTPLEVPLGLGESGPLTLLVHPAGRRLSDEARDVARSLAGQAAVALEDARSQLAVLEKTNTDELTRLYNRLRFTDALGAEVERFARTGTPFTVVLADLDDFGVVNDEFGRITGDAVLRGFAEVLRQNLRAVDLAARIGDDEFAVLLPETEAEGAASVAERLHSSLESQRLVTADGRSIPASASFGLATVAAGDTAGTLLTRADDALAEAKADGSGIASA